MWLKLHCGRNQINCERTEQSDNICYFSIPIFIGQKVQKSVFFMPSLKQEMKSLASFDPLMYKAKSNQRNVSIESDA